MEERRHNWITISTHLMGSNTSLYRESRTKANQSISPKLVINNRTNMRQRFKMRKEVCGNKTT